MNILNFLSKKKTTAPVARERLQLLLAHERVAVGRSDLVGVLREEILAVIGKHVAMDPERVRVSMEHGDSISTLEVEVDIPAHARLKVAIAS